MGGDLDKAPEVKALLTRVKEFARDEIAPLAPRWELKREFPRDTFQRGARLGLSGLLIAKDLGGVGLSHVSALQVYEELAGACLPFCFTLFVQHNVAAGIAAFGSAHHKDRYLPPLLSGQRIGAFCLTEPNAGSDAAAISMLASKNGDEWRLDGEKAWVTNGTTADLLSVYAQTDPTLRSRGIACFLVEAGDGVERGTAYSMMGGHVMGVNAIRFSGCKVPQAAVILEAGSGFKGAMAGINRARTMIAAMCCGILRNCLDASLRYAKSRTAFGRSLSDFQGLQFEFAEVATDLEASRALAFQAALALDAGQSAAISAAHAKKFATQAASRGIAVCLRLMGANGYLLENPHARHLASAQMCEFLDGTEEIQNLIIARSLFATTSNN